MLFAGACFALMGVFVKLGGSWFSSHELVFYRSLVGLFLLLAGVALYRGVRGEFKLFGSNTGLQIRRGLVGFVALSMFFYALARLPLSVAVTLNYTSPLFLTILMPWQLNVRPSRVQYMTVAAGFVGVLLLLRPWQTEVEDLVAGAVGLFSGVMAAFAYIHVTQLGRLHEPEWRTVFWFALVCAVGAGALVSVDGGWHGVVSVDQVDLILALGVSATLGQLAMTRAYRTGQTVVVASFAYSTVVFASLLDVLFFDEKMPLMAGVGICITVLAGVQAARLNERVSK